MKKIILSALLFTGSLAAIGQEEDLKEKVLFTVEHDTVTAGEYMAVYNKNRNLGEDIDPKTPREYLDLYVNFKMKVHEAKEKGMDTVPSFVREYNSYRDQLAKPYLTDKGVTEELIKEAFRRMKYDVAASHIMIGVPEGARPVDTAKAYKKIMSIKQKLEDGAMFSKMAEEYSDDTYSAKQGGSIGYFTVFNMVYPFESAAYETEVGEVTGPVRSRYGYHLVKTTDKRPARGTVEVAHIMVVDNDKEPASERKENAKQKIYEIFGKLKDGEDFATLAKQYSEDPSSAAKGGVLPEFGINKMYAQFEDAAFALENAGDYSEPIKTPVGWHIIKLIDKKGQPEWEKARLELKEKVERDSRSQQSRISVIKKLKLEYGFREYPKVMDMTFDQVDESFLRGNYKAEDIEGAEKVLFEFAGKEYTVEDFLSHLESLRARRGDNLYKEVNQAYDEYSEGELIAYEKGRLEEKYPDFRLLSREYFEGILLFDLTEDMVWKKSVSDSAGLRDYYEAHKEQYQWKERYNAYIVDADSKKMAKKAKKLLKKGKTKDEVVAELNEDSQLNVKIDSSVYEAGAKDILKMLEEKEEGFSKIVEKDGRYFVVKIEEVIPAGGKSFKEARGAVISDYQTHLEEEWISDLKKKYEVDINKQVLKEVIAELESQS